MPVFANKKQVRLDLFILVQLVVSHFCCSIIPKLFISKQASSDNKSNTWNWLLIGIYWNIISECKSQQMHLL